MSATRLNRDQFYAVMAPSDDARLRKVLWTLYWRGSAQLRERIEDELRSPEQPKVKPKKELLVRMRDQDGGKVDYLVVEDGGWLAHESAGLHLHTHSGKEFALLFRPEQEG
jgi:hypothetical protein